MTENEQFRKIQKIGSGSGSYTVTLPKDWINDVGLDRQSGDRMVRIIQGPENQLIIYPATVSEIPPPVVDRAEIQVSENIAQIKKIPDEDTPERFECELEIDMLLREIIAAYLIGKTEILVNGEISQDVRDRLEIFATRRLLGVSVHHDENEILFRWLDPQIPLRNAISNIRYSVNKIFTLLKGLITGPYSQKMIYFIDKENAVISQYYFYIVRLLKAAVVDSKRAVPRHEMKSARDILGMRIMLMSIERISNHAKKIAILLGKENVKFPLKKDLRRKLRDGVNVASNSFEKIMEVFPFLTGKSNFDQANEAIRDLHRQRKMMEQLKDHEMIRNNSNLRIIVESVGRICEYTSNVGEMVLNLTIEDLLTSRHEH